MYNKIVWLSYKTILLANEQDSPVLSGSMFNCSIWPSLITMEYLLERMPPNAGKLIAKSKLFVSSAQVSASRRT